MAIALIPSSIIRVSACLGRIHCYQLIHLGIDEGIPGIQDICDKLSASMFSGSVSLQGPSSASATQHPRPWYPSVHHVPFWGFPSPAHDLQSKLASQQLQLGGVVYVVISADGGNRAASAQPIDGRRNAPPHRIINVLGTTPQHHPPK